ncbi:hypothetical protein A3Q56_07382 [Intoshia linei]|uniref:Retropepsins domain-containing protein n=1 Tax=Intoshia linei TaxID=1819745 RepID=A0A177AU53_9BILA|nr:hypothetical protein A3Q56_07382 [Intoshia linei]
MKCQFTKSEEKNMYMDLLMRGCRIEIPTDLKLCYTRYQPVQLISIMKTYKNLNNNTQKPFQNNNYYNKKVRLVENGNLCENVKLSTKSSKIKVNFIIDTGSQVNCLNLETLEKLSVTSQIQNTNETLLAVNNQRLPVIGKVKFRINKQLSFEFMITRNTENLLLVNSILIPNNINEKYKTIIQNSDAFDIKSGLTNLIYHEIPFIKGAKYPVAKNYATPKHMQRFEHEIIQNMITKNR